MTVIHVLLLAFAPLATPQEIEQTIQSLLALKDKCIHPTSQKPYMKATRGGINLTPDGFAGGYTHSFVMEFENAEDCAYYSDHDPAHLEFINNTSNVMSKVLVVDFTAGVF